MFILFYIRIHHPCQLRQEKVDLENTLEQEEEFLTNKLQKQLFEVQAEREYDFFCSTVWVCQPNLIQFLHSELQRKLEEFTDVKAADPHYIRIRQLEKDLARYKQRNQDGSSLDNLYVSKHVNPAFQTKSRFRL